MSMDVRQVWIPAARPKTLAAAVAPVLMGVGMAIADQQFHVGAALAALLGALLIQIGTNFANDYFDARKGTDTPDRVGPTRATATGQVTPGAMRRAFLLAFSLALLCGIYLTWLAGWPVVVIGVLAIAFGILYTGGPAPLAYVGLADPFVLVFFGPVAVAGTLFVQTGLWSTEAIVAGLAPGLIAVALLTVNNLRDIRTDRQAQKWTLAARFGPRFAKTQYALCVVGATAVPFVLWQAFAAPVGVLAASGACLLAIPPMRDVVRANPGDDLLKALAGTGRWLVLFGLAFFLGWTL